MPNGKRLFEESKKEARVYKHKKYIAQTVLIDIKAGKDIVVLNEKDAEENDINAGDRVGIKIRDNVEIVIVDVSSQLVKEGEIGIFTDVAEKYRISEGDIVEIVHVPMPLSLEAISKKINGGIMTKNEISSIINDLMENKLAEPELAAWITAIQIRGLNDDETIYLTQAMVDSGDKLSLPKHPVVDKHCIGGVPGNRTTMLIVPIVASAGLYIPKTSSRAITSPAGTADTMEVLANVNFSMEELKEIVLKARGAIVWGGGINIAPADDHMIRIRRPLHLDPKGVLLASILAKKKAVGSEYVIVDIPVGRGAKVEDINMAKDLADDFRKLGAKLGMKIGVVITDGSEPIGNGVGPALEARDVLRVLEGNGPSDLKEKAVLMAGKLLEMSGKVSKGDGYDVAKHFLESGKALKKMKEIIELQGGNPDVKADEIPVGEYREVIKAEKEGKIEHIDNRAISKIARAAGAPFDKGAGIYLFKSKGDRVKVGDPLFEIYAESEAKLTFAIKMLEEFKPIKMEKMLLEEFY